MQGEIIPHQPHQEEAHRIERFQSLAAGQYWRAKVTDDDQHVNVGEVLLVESLKWVDNEVHTVVLRAHPLKFGRTPKGRTWGSLTEHRFRVADFLAKFEFEPDAQAVRAEEVARVQGEIQAMQGELMRAQRDPAVLASVVAQRLDAARLEAPDAGAGEGESESGGPSKNPMESTSRAVAIDHAAAVHIGQITLGGAIQGGLTATHVDALRAQAQREHQVATIKASWIREQTTAIAERVQTMVPFFNEQAAAALAATEDVRTYVTDLLRGIASLDLYVGTGVQVTTICEGAGAPEDVPLSFVQKKLLMDEELAVWADVDEDFDFESIEKFLEAMRAHPAFIDQVFPTQRCVLVMATTLRLLDYGNPFESASKNEMNRQVFMLARNGGNVYLIESPVESHLRAARLFPSKDEHEGVFCGLDGTQTRFEDVTYADRMAEHALFALHYRRFLILVCGLDHRLGLFGKFYPGEPSMAFLSMPFQEAYCRFIYDDDASLQIAGPAVMPALQDWIDGRNAYLRSGARVLCNWSALMTPDTAPGACEARSHRRQWKASPIEHPGVKVVHKDGQDLCVEVHVKRSGWERESEFNARVAINRHRKHQWDGISEDLPYLVLDAVSPDDVRWYIHHRDSRRNQLTYIRLFKKALAFLEGEALRQAPAKAKLRQALLDGNVVSEADCAAVIDQAVLAWRAANRGRELPALEALSDPREARAWTALLDQMFALARSQAAPIDVAAAFAASRGEVPIRLSMTGRGRHVLYTALASADDRGEPYAWVQRTVLEIGKRGGARGASSSRVRLLEVDAAETVLHVWDRELEELLVLRGKKNRAFVSPQAKSAAFAFLDDVLTCAAQWGRTLAPEAFEARYAKWYSQRRESPVVVLPVAVAVDPKGGQAVHVCLQARLPILLGRLAPDEALRARLRRTFAAIYMREDHWKRVFDRDMDPERSPWSVVTLPVETKGVWADIRTEGGDVVPGTEILDPLASEALKLYAAHAELRHLDVLWSAQIEGAFSRVDSVLGLARPADFAPTLVMETRVRRDKDEAWVMVFDVCALDHQDFLSVRERLSHVALLQAFGSRSCSSTYERFATMRQAQRYLETQQNEHRAQGFEDLVNACERPNLPQPPSGVSRWFLIPKD